MRVITAPRNYGGSTRGKWSLFLAGGISGCENWQARFIKRLLQEDHQSLENWIVFNPRREEWPMDHETKRRKAQIVWEQENIVLADYVLFWFPNTSVCPITLYELGQVSRLLKKGNIFIGMEKDYPKALDMKVQLDIQGYTDIYRTFDDLYKAVSTVMKERNPQ